MIRKIGMLVIVAALGVLAVGLDSRAGDAKSGGNLAHMVFFKLKDNSPEAAAKLVAACKKLLSGHEGEVYFSAGTLAQDLNREVNDRDFDVALHMVFKDLASHDKYQVHTRHETFIKENKDNWAKVRVFDSYVGGK